MVEQITQEELMLVNRRGLLIGLGSLIASPAIVSASNLMPVRSIITIREIIVSGTDQYGNPVTEIIRYWARGERIVSLKEYKYIGQEAEHF